MLQTQETPAGGAAGASRDSFAGLSLSLSSLDLYRTQFPILAAHCGADWLAIMAAAALGGGRP